MIKNKIHIYRAIIILIGIFAIGPLWSQQSKVQNLITFDEEPYHFGFLLGANQMLFTINSKDPSLGAEGGPGFTVGIVSDLRLGKYFNLRFIPNLQFGERSLSGSKNEFRSTLLTFPLNLKINGKRMHNTRPYVIVGGSYAKDFGKYAKTRAKKSITTDFILESNDFYVDTGVGFDFYFYLFKMSLEIKMSYGTRDIIYRRGSKNPWANSISKLKSKIFQFNVTIE